MGEVLPREFPVHEVQPAGLIVRNSPLGSLPLHTCQIKVHGNTGPCASWPIVVQLEPLQSPGDDTLTALPSQSSCIFSLFFSSPPKKRKSQAPKASFSQLSCLFAQGVAGERNGRAQGRPGIVWVWVPSRASGPLCREQGLQGGCDNVGQPWRALSWHQEVSCPGRRKGAESRQVVDH